MHKASRQGVVSGARGPGACVPAAGEAQAWRELMAPPDTHTGRSVYARLSRGCPPTTRHQPKAATTARQGLQTKRLSRESASYSRLTPSYGGMATLKPRRRGLATSRDARTRRSSEALRPSWPGPLYDKHTIAGEALDLFLATGRRTDYFWDGEAARPTPGMAETRPFTHEQCEDLTM